jgi:Flp pilus assembly protein TadG
MRFARREDGAAAIEFALIAPVILILFIGMANLGFRYLEEGRLTQVARETAQAALYTSDTAVLQQTLNTAILQLGSPLSGSNYRGTVIKICICPGSADIPNCTTSQARSCVATSKPWEIVIDVVARMDYEPLLPGVGAAQTISKSLRVQVR